MNSLNNEKLQLQPVNKNFQFEMCVSEVQKPLEFQITFRMHPPELSVIYGYINQTLVLGY